VRTKTFGSSRREFLCAAASLIAAPAAFSAPPSPPIKPEDVKFLEDCAHRSFGYFWDHWNPHTGLVKDRAGVDGSPSGQNVASIAATGFGLSAMCIAASRAWVTREQARQHVLTTLRFLWGHAFHDHGWYLHFMDADTGQSRLSSEISSIDTALLLAGVLAVQGYFSNDREIRGLARDIYERVDFAWMLNGSKILCHGVKQDSGFLNARWQTYSEASILYLLAIGSPRHSIPVDSWYAWLRPEVRFDSWTFVSGGALFTHQYSHAWIDFRHLRDGDPSFLDYFQNSQIATYAHRDFCISLSSKYSDYGPNMWGMTVSDGPLGYVDWGGTTTMHNSVNGTLVPCAAAGSLMFTPEICLPALREMFNQYGDRIYRRYGFADAFNPNWKDKKFWVDHDVVGIDVGITLLSIENLLTGDVWRYFMRNAYIQNAMEKVGFRISTPGNGIPQVRTGASRA